MLPIAFALIILFTSILAVNPSIPINDDALLGIPVDEDILNLMHADCDHRNARIFEPSVLNIDDDICKALYAHEFRISDVFDVMTSKCDKALFEKFIKINGLIPKESLELLLIDFSWRGCLEIAKMFVEPGVIYTAADIYGFDQKEGGDAIVIAYNNKHDDIVRTLAASSARREAAVYQACKKGYDKLLQMLDVVPSFDMLLGAAVSGHVHLLRKYVKNPTDTEKNILLTAAIEGRYGTKVVYYILGRDYKLDITQETLVAAVRFGDIVLLQRLLMNRPKNLTKATGLAAYFGDMNMFNLLVSRGANGCAGLTPALIGNRQNIFEEILGRFFCPDVILLDTRSRAIKMKNHDAEKLIAKYLSVTVREF